MNLDFLPESARIAGLGPLMKGVGTVARRLPIPQPTLLVGAGSSARLGQAVAAFGHRRVLVVTDRVIVQLGLHRPLVDALAAGGVQVAVFDAITPDAPIPLIEQGVAAYREHDADTMVAIGGGSSIDASKAIASAVANPRKKLRELAGYYKGLRSPGPIYAVPTTAGTGSEVTVAAVIADPANKSKVVIVDTRLVPRMAALDPALMTGLPAPITAATGIDALTHAVEAFIGHWASDHTDSLALAAVGMVFQHLRTACHQGSNLEAREQMALASTYAGMAFTRANVGYVHAIAHQFGGRYHTPHGLANAIVLPHVLRFSLPAASARLARLAVRAGLGQPSERDDQLAQRFIDAVEALCADIGIPTTLAALKSADIPGIARAALAEGQGYPVPRYMTQTQCEGLLRKLLPPAADPKADARPAAKKRAARKPRAADANT
ncbi:MAG TPA: iron-containing alcohol dehydrogenase [Aquabacterium sp.]|nr:iron-containing alcohol dehydrogenase [Aquabacterium sp.]HQC95441.1 iron-containing alcohol dehydrogenase [Aquabacterium sp.]